MAVQTEFTKRTVSNSVAPSVVSADIPGPLSTILRIDNCTHAHVSIFWFNDVVVGHNLWLRGWAPPGDMTRVAEPLSPHGRLMHCSLDSDVTSRLRATGSWFVPFSNLSTAAPNMSLQPDIQASGSLVPHVM